jgi:hypothetical protein
MRSSTGERVAPALDPQAVRAQMERILASPHLRNSRRCQSLLKYVVDTALEGTPERIKERTIGVEVFGRDSGYDTNQDPIVRNAAIEVRKRLAQYYQEPGREEELRIVLPAGGYVPVIRPADMATPEIATGPTEAETEPPPRRKRRVAAIAAVGIAAIVAGAVAWSELAPTELDRFWAPLTKDRDDVVICVGQPKRLYTFTGPHRREYDEKLAAGASQTSEAAEATKVPLSEISQAGPAFFYFGDALSTIKAGGLLQAKNKRFLIRGEATTPYQDLRGHPVVLIGGFNNRWTQRLTGDLRFYFVRLPEQNKDELRDRQNPGKQPWVVWGEPRSGETFDDYAIVSRVVDPATEKTLIAIAGVTQFGTQSAGDFITNAGYLHAAFAHAPADWHRKNLQVVLKTRVVTGAAGPPQVMAWNSW